jgi:peptidoglycan/LPS O-acetylase OafA/YrhL
VVKERSLALDVLRILAASWVVLGHWLRDSQFHENSGLAIRPHFAEPFETLTFVGALGVDVFFILSGAVIAHSAVNRPWDSFAKSRFLRLFPVYVLATALSIIFVPMVWSGAESRSEYLFSLTGLNFWTGHPLVVFPAWTLAIEIQFYALVGLFIWRSKMLTPENVRTGAAWFMILGLVARLSQWEPFQLVTMSQWAPYFALGALVSCTTTRELLRRNLLLIGIAVALSMDALNARIATITTFSAHHRWLVVLIVVVLVLTFLFQASFNWGKAGSPSRVRKFVQTSALMTYPVYLFHDQLGWALLVGLVVGLRLPIQVGFPLVCLALLAASFASVTWFEPASRKLLRTLFGWKPASSVSERGKP